MPTTAFLDNIDECKKLDTLNSLGSIEQLGSQVQHVWEVSRNLHFDESYKDIDNVVVAGMGGSILGTHVIQTVFKDELKLPVMIVPDYEMPSYVNQRTLVIASSYSGTTEETLAAIKDAQAKGAKIAGITSGGPLATFLRENNYPAVIFEPTYNPSNSPRMALGYSVFGQMALFAQAGLLKIEESEYQAVMETIAQFHMQYSIQVPQESNAAKVLAYEMIDRIPVITAAEHLEGVSHVLANQLNESGKNYSEYRVIPELNHHLMEGLQFPQSAHEVLLFVTIHSDLYLRSNAARLDLTQEVLDQNKVEYRMHKISSQSKLQQAFEFLLFGTYTAFYLALLNNQNPTPNPWVDWFKEQLKKRSHN